MATQKKGGVYVGAWFMPMLDLCLGAHYAGSYFAL